MKFYSNYFKNDKLYKCVLNVALFLMKKKIKLKLTKS